MALPKNEIFFRPGRLEKSGRRNPGILALYVLGKFDNKMDMNYHKQRVHEFGETCSMYPCEECGFKEPID